MAVTNLTLTIAGTTYPILNDGNFKLSSKIDERSELDVTVIDLNSAWTFSKGQQVTLTDTLQGILFTGFVNTSQITKYPGTNLARIHQLVCIDNHFIADKRTTNKQYTNQYAGIIVAGMIDDVLTAEGVTANYAIREDDTQAEFTQGTLSGTSSTSNLGGDLELQPAGTQIMILENSSSIFGSGTLTNCQVSGQSLIPTPTPTIKITGTESLTQDGNGYCYIKIFSSGSISVASSRYLVYDIWIDPTSPEIKSGVDIVFTDGTTLRDTSQIYFFYDQQNIPPHPNNDLSGFANGKWYHRSFLLDNFAGKTIAYVTVVFEGDKQGKYTTYIKNIYEVDSSNTIINTFFNGSFNVNPPKYMQNSGYSNVTIGVVNTYDCVTQSCNRVSPSYSIDAAKIVRSSFITMQSTLPANTNIQLEYSIDGGNSYIVCTDNTALPDLVAGLSIAGFSIQFRQTFQQLSGASPESQPALSAMQCIINPSYQATKSDVSLSATTTAQWNTGTFSNTEVTNGVLSLLGLVRNFAWMNTDLSGFTIFGDEGTGPSTTTVNMHCNRGTMWVATGINMEGHARYDSVGSWQDQCIECDLYIDGTSSSWRPSIIYRTTGWSNYANNHAYAAEFTLDKVMLWKGSNSSASSDGTATQISSVSISISSASWHHVKIVVSGTTHQIYVDDVLYINVTDSTYNISGNVGLRAYNPSTTQGYEAQFNNFGITVTGLSGTWTSASQSLSTVGTYGNSIVSWEDVSIGNGTSILVQSSVDGGSTWQTVNNGGTIANLTVGQSLASISLKLKVTLSTQSASSMPQIQYLVARILGQYSSSGTRISPSLSLTPALVCGSSVINWKAITPTNTAITVATSTDNVTYTTASNGGSITGITSQPLATLDTFDADDHTSYIVTNRAGFAATQYVPRIFGGTIVKTTTSTTWTWDVPHSRIIAANGNNGMLLYTSIWFNTNYLNKKQIVLDHTKVSGGTDLTNFPVLIAMVDPQLATIANGGYVQNNNGYDIIFVNNLETTKLDHEIENYNPVTGEIEMWVRIPSLSHTTDTSFFVYFNNASISTTQANPTGVWDANYKAVWHMGAATGSNQSDSTSNGLTATENNSPTQSTGQIAESAAFNGTSQYLSVSGGAANITGDKSIELWLNTESYALDASGADPRVLINNIDGTNVYQIVLDADNGGSIGFAVNDTAGQHTIGNATWGFGVWYHVVGTYVASSHTVTLYINGVSVPSNITLSLALGNTGFNIGRRTDAVGYFLGSLDEVRVSSIVRSPGWIATSFANQNSPQSFFSVGSLLSQSLATSNKDVDIIADTDQADCAGIVWREQDTSNFYELDLYDSASNAGTTNVLKLYKVVANTKTQLGASTAITFNRGTPYRTRVVMIGTSITVYFDGNSVLTTTDNALAGPGKSGLIDVSGGAHFYNFRIQPLGQSLSGVNAYSKVTLSSTDPTVTPQLTDLVLAALHPNITLGSLIPTVSYLYTYISKNMDDLSKKSNAFWKIDQNLNMLFSLYQSIPSPWILTDKDILVAGPQALQVKNNGDLYRNRQNITGVVATGTNSEYKVGDGTTRSWTLGGILIEKPTIYLNGQVQTVGTKGIDTGKNFYWTSDSAVIDQDSSGTLLQQTDQLFFPNYTYQYTTDVTIDNTGQFPGTVSISAFAALSGGTGIVEETEDVSGQNINITAATAMANDYLQRFGKIGIEIQCSTMRSGLAVGQYLSVFNPESSTNDVAFLITSVDMTQVITVDQASGQATQTYFYALTLESSVNVGSWSKLLASTMI